MSAAVPSGRRITSGLLKGYFIRTSSSYPAYPREFPAGVRKSFRHSLCVSSFPRRLTHSAEKCAASRGTRVRLTFRSSDSRKVKARSEIQVRAKRPYLYDAPYNGILRDGNLTLERRFIFREVRERSFQT